MDKIASDSQQQSKVLAQEVTEERQRAQQQEAKFQGLEQQFHAVQAEVKEAKATASQVASQIERLRQDWSAEKQDVERRGSNLEQHLQALQREEKYMAANIDRLQGFLGHSGASLEKVATWIAQTDEKIKNEVGRALEMQDQKVTEQLINQALQNWLKGANFERRLERMKTEITAINQQSLVLVMQNQAEQQDRDKKEKEVIRTDLAHIQREVQTVAQHQQDLRERLQQARDTISNQQIKTPSDSSISIGTFSG